MGKYRTPSNFSGIKVEVGGKEEASFSSVSIGRQVLLPRVGFIPFLSADLKEGVGEVDVG